MDIDWSKAPEGATHYDMESELFVSEDSIWVYGKENARAKKAILSSFGRYIPRPTKAPEVEWNGKGLPPVGIQCELDDPALGGWNACTVKWVGRELVVVDRPEGGEFCVLKHDRNFRPIRTKQQRQREEFKQWFMDNRWNDIENAIDDFLSRYTLESKP